MFRFINGLLKSDRPARKPARTLLGVEALDRRDLPSITMIGSTILIGCDNGNDAVTVTHNTTYDTIVVTRKYGNNKTETKSYLADPIDFGVGPVQKKPTLIKCNLQNGTNSFTNSTNIASEVTGGSGKDTMTGGSKQDIFKGNGGDDSLYGGDGPDRLYGGTGNDLMDGNSGDDWLYGHAGLDYLKGGPGVDGLYGGGGMDVLDGHGSSDRFLLSESNPDAILGYDEAVDVKIFFENTTSSTSFSGSKYGAKSWTEAEVEKVDKAFAVIHEKTGTNLLLKHDAGIFDDDYLHFRRVGGRISGKFLDGSNDGFGTIKLTNSAFSNDGNVIQTTIHEIGHEWEDEYGFDHGWLGLSGWTDDNPGSTAYVKGTGTDDDWWHLKSAKFVSDYAKSSPKEDFSESFAAYFLNLMGNPYSASSWKGAAETPAKMEWMADFVGDHSVPDYLTNW